MYHIFVDYPPEAQPGFFLALERMEKSADGQYPLIAYLRLDVAEIEWMMEKIESAEKGREVLRIPEGEGPPLRVYAEYEDELLLSPSTAAGAALERAYGARIATGYIGDEPVLPAPAKIAGFSLEVDSSGLLWEFYPSETSPSVRTALLDKKTIAATYARFISMRDRGDLSEKFTHLLRWDREEAGRLLVENPEAFERFLTPEVCPELLQCTDAKVRLLGIRLYASEQSFRQGLGGPSSKVSWEH